MKIAIGCDHAGYEYKEMIKKGLTSKGHEIIDAGTHSDDSVDYPDFVHPVAKMVNDEEVDRGILICGSGNGVSMTANKYSNVRAALCWNKSLAVLARQHNNANIVSIPARFISRRMASMIVGAFIKTSFEGGRHLRRVNKISKC
jgi:ribose 5-phosphate isomerase B